MAMKIGKSTVPRTAISRDPSRSRRTRCVERCRHHGGQALACRGPGGARLWPSAAHERDPRVAALFRVAKEAKVDQRYVQIAEAVEQIIPDTIGKDLRLNVSVANAATGS